MKKVLLLVLMVLFVFVPTAFALEGDYTDNIIQNEHKVMNKWDLQGTFNVWDSYNWGGLLGSTCNYDIHIKQAVNQDYSVGSITFYDDNGFSVTGKVEATKDDYAYWNNYNNGRPNLAAAGTVEYNETTYYFMFLYAERAVWMALSETPYDTYWNTGDVYGGGIRAFQVHSVVDQYDFPIEYKEIHDL
jgi:hypothetical protein